MGFLHTRRADPAPWCSPVLLVGRGFVSPSDTMRDGGLEPFAPFPRTLFGGLPIVLVTRTESCTNPVLTGTIKYDRLSEEGRDLYTRFPKDRKAVAHRSFPRAPQGAVNKRSPMIRDRGTEQALPAGSVQTTMVYNRDTADSHGPGSTWGRTQAQRYFTRERSATWWRAPIKRAVGLAPSHKRNHSPILAVGCSVRG